MIQHNRYFLETDPETLGQVDALAIRKHTSQVDSGIASVKFRRGIIDGLATEVEKIGFVLSLVNRLEAGIEVAIRKKDSRKFNLDDKIMTEEEWRALVPHESEAEVPPVPTYGKIIEYMYATAFRDAGIKEDR